MLAAIAAVALVAHEEESDSSTPEISKDNYSKHSSKRLLNE
jgi:hypothetical protein